MDSDDDEEEDGGHIYEDDVHEMRAFMRMFMDLVGIFNEDQVVPDDEKVPGKSSTDIYCYSLYLSCIFSVLSQVCRLA